QAVIRLCWQAPQREWQQLANDILMKAKKQLTADFMELIEWCILHKSWWDTVDFLAGHSMAAILSRHPKLERTEPDRWIASNNIWLQRTALLYQLFYRDQLDFERLKDYILLVADSKEFFVQKAAGWALRQASRLRGPEVIEFVQTHDDLLPKLTKTEALKWLEHQSKKS
ncbi:MAG: DNA alkylation repair protein, partial [Bacteroidota bacterium]